MGSAYLQGSDISTFGVPTATAAEIQNASAVVDAYLQRPEGMVWAPDANGWPCYMAAMSPNFSLNSTGSIAAGLNVVVPVTGGMASADHIGDVLILDRSDPTKTEACVVSAISPTSVTLQSVTRAHSSGCALEGGLVLMEERALPARRSVTRVSRTPVARLIAGAGRYAYGRRSDQTAGLFYEPSILASVQVFGGPPMWSPFDPAQASVSAGTGDVWIPVGIMLASFSDVRLRYVAGYPFSGLPTPIKQGTADIIMNIQSYPELSGNLKSYQAGGTKVERFADTLLDAETKALLGPFQAKMFF